MKSISMVTQEEDKDLNQVLFTTVVAKDQYLVSSSHMVACVSVTSAPGDLVGFCGPLYLHYASIPMKTYTCTQVKR